MTGRPGGQPPARAGRRYHICLGPGEVAAPILLLRALRLAAALEAAREGRPLWHPGLGHALDRVS